MPLPLLREELSLHEAGQDWDGSPCWLIQDQTGNHYHRIGWLEFEFLTRWETNDPQALLDRICKETTLRPTEDDLLQFLAFLEQHNLIRNTSAEGAAKLAARTRAQKQSPEQWLLHHYLFFRIPLLKSDALLDRIMPICAPLLTRGAVIFFALLGFIGLYLAARQWDVFTTHFVNTLTTKGLLSYILAIAVAKCVHELGHALLAKKAGLRVPRIGIAFLVMFPFLYTDLGEGWLLHDHRRRRLISAGGILAEVSLASVSLFLWSVLADGALRDAFYVLAIVSLVSSFLINISPFMRFDGYYLLSDHFNIPNLQQRAFAFTRYVLRWKILGSDEDPPEHLPPRLRRFFIIFSITTWIYRLVVFLGIAITVYLFFFKTLGIILMIVELVYFIALPIIQELLVWRKNMSRVSVVRLVIAGVTVGLLLLILLIPWRGQLTLPAILSARVKQPVYAPFAARVSEVTATGTTVKAGNLLFLLDAEETRFQVKLSRMQAMELRDRLRRLPMESKGREQAAIWQEEAMEREHFARAQSAELKRLELPAEVDGVFMDVDEGVRPGVYVTSHTLLGVVVNPLSSEIEAYADETAAGRIKPGAKVRFYSDTKGHYILKGQVASIDSSRLTSLPTPALADRHGGAIATSPSTADHERLIPRDSLYRVRIKLISPQPSSHLETGTVSVEVEPESIAGRLVRQAVSVILRESGF
jgi:putative peptide zinc metalloprotease protein